MTAPLPPQPIDKLQNLKVTITNASSLPINVDGRLTPESIDNILAILTSEIEKAATAARIDELSKWVECADTCVKDRITDLKATLNQKGSQQ